MENKISKYIKSYDTIAALVVLMFAICCVPSSIKNGICADVFEIGITVLSIIFSIFFASLAVIMSFPDNAFIKFIEKGNGLFSKILSFFRITLSVLFIALLYTIIVYIYSKFNADNSNYSKLLFCVFSFVFTYSLVATFISVDFTLKITSRRATFIIQDDEPKQDD
jgi:hypothetical protein